MTTDQPTAPSTLTHPWAIYQLVNGHWTKRRTKAGKPITHTSYGNALGIFLLCRFPHDSYCIAPA